MTHSGHCEPIWRVGAGVGEGGSVTEGNLLTLGRQWANLEGSNQGSFGLGVGVLGAPTCAPKQRAHPSMEDLWNTDESPKTFLLCFL
eukprot:5363280-Amphidinium_carterae.1